MDYNIPGLPDERVIKISRFYTLVRQILASVSFWPDDLCWST